MSTGSSRAAALPVAMRAVSLRAAQSMEVVELPRPEPAAGEVLVRLLGNGICGSDLHFWHHGPAGEPGVLGHEMCGEVVAVGAALDDGLLGVRGAIWSGNACGTCALCRDGLGHFCASAPTLGGFRPDTLGGLAEYVCVEPHRVLPADPALRIDQIALAEPLANAIRALDRDGVREARHCLVIGCGPLGLAHVAAARALGIPTVVAVEGRAKRRAAALAVGADEVIDPGDDLARACTARFGVGPDLVVECVGSPATTYLATSVVRPTGTVLLMGVCGEPFRVNTYRWLEREIVVRTSIGTGATEQRLALDWIEWGVVDVAPLISAHIGLDEVPEAFAALAAGADEVKIVVEHQR